jgi:hypothetical protein
LAEYLAKYLFGLDRALIGQKFNPEAQSRSTIHPRDDPLTVMKVIEIGVPDEIRAVRFIAASLFRLDFSLFVASSKECIVEKPS